MECRDIRPCQKLRSIAQPVVAKSAVSTKSGGPKDAEKFVVDSFLLCGFIGNGVSRIRRMFQFGTGLEFGMRDDGRPYLTVGRVVVTSKSRMNHLITHARRRGERGDYESQLR